MKLKILTLGAGLALAAGAAAIAGEPGHERVEERVVIMGGPGGHGDMDANRDGAVTRDEFRGLHDRMFDKLDKNHDGKLAGDEFRHHGPGERFEIELDGPGGHRGGPSHHGPGERDVRVLRHGPGERGDIDANKDGRVSFEEFSAPMREHFREMDKNGNGVLDGDEMKGDHRFMIRREIREDGERG